MTLGDYIRREKLNYTSYGKRIDRAPQTVRRWCLPADHPDRRIPAADEMKIVFADTAGEVTANDFYGLEAAAA